MNNHEKEQELKEIARIRSGNDSYDPKLIKSIDQAVKTQTTFGIQHLELSEEKTEERAIQALKVISASRKKGGNRRKNKETIKEALKHFFEQGKEYTSTNEVTEWAVEHGLCHTNSPKGIGDTMGRGRNGLFLEECDAKVQGRKVLKTPPSEEFEDWYESDIPLPRKYYTDSYWEKLLIEEGASTHSTFFEDRI